MSEIITVGLDLAKYVFQADGADAWELRREQVLALFGQLRPCVVAMEACAAPTSGIGKLGQKVR